MVRDAQLLIVGAGPAGLATALAYGDGAQILEQGDEVGGLCRSIEFGGAVFDIGGHSFHSPHPEVTALVEDLMHGRWTRQRRDARVWFGGALIDYPFQQHLDQIADPAIAEACRRSLPTGAPAVPATNFEDWIVRRFGDGVARHFMLPYNRKLWGRDLRRMSCEWVSERIAGADAGPGSQERRAPLAPHSEVAYPADGGFGEIYQAMARRCGALEFGRRVVHIDPSGGTALTAGGQTWTWERMVSTMPLPLLLRAIEGCPAGLIEDADCLEFVSLKVAMVCVAEPLGEQPQRIYAADPHIPAHKIAFNHTSSPSLRARPSHAIMAEIAYSPEKPPAPDAQLEAAMIDWLADAGLIGARANVAETRILDITFGYPVYTHERPAILARIGDYLAPLGIHSIGRFGAWEYVNSDACILQGMRLGEALSAGAR